MELAALQRETSQSAGSQTTPTYTHSAQAAQLSALQEELANLKKPSLGHPSETHCQVQELEEQLRLLRQGQVPPAAPSGSSNPEVAKLKEQLRDVKQAAQASQRRMEDDLRQHQGSANSSAAKKYSRPERARKKGLAVLQQPDPPSPQKAPTQSSSSQSKRTASKPPSTSRDSGQPRGAVVKDDAPAVGIDFGSTCSSVSVWNQTRSRIDIIASEFGERTTPSYVAFTDQERLVGTTARYQAAKNPENTVFDVKRMLGRDFSDPVVQADMKYWPFEVVEGPNDRLLIELEHKGERKQFTAQEIAAAVFAKMKQTAEDILGKPVVNAVVSVPAAFNNAQRRATKEAATISGLNVLRLINEPSAAALAYGVLKQAGQTASEYLLLFDLGGGTFDVSLVQIDDGVYEVIATAGDTHLGGVDFDNRLIGLFCAEFRRKFNGKDLTQSRRSLQRLRNACERAKRALSSWSEVAVEIDALYDGEDFYTTISRDRFELLCEDLFTSTLRPVREVLRCAGVSRSDVSQVVLVGGSTRIPMIQTLLYTFFKRKEPCQSINPEEVVAYGAAVQAAILDGVSNKLLDETILLDVNALPLGVETDGECMSVIVDKHTCIPVNKSQVFSTTDDDQCSVTIEVFEGHRPSTRDNTLLGTLDLTGIPPAPRGSARIEVNFDIDANGVLSVTAKDRNISDSIHLVSANLNVGSLSRAEFDRMLDDAERYRADEALLSRNIEAKNSLEACAYATRKIITARHLKDRFRVHEMYAVEQAVERVLAWLEHNQHAEKEEYEEQENKLMALARPIIDRVTTGDPRASRSRGRMPTR